MQSNSNIFASCGACGTENKQMVDWIIHPNGRLDYPLAGANPS